MSRYSKVIAQTDRQSHTHRQTHIQTDRQTDTHTHTHTQTDRQTDSIKTLPSRILGR